MKTQRAVSFDESSMESCTTMLQEEHQHHQQQQQQQQHQHQQQQQQHRRYGRDSCESCESYESRESCRDNGCNRDRGSESNQEVTSLEEAKTVIAALKARQRAQAHQMLAWRRTLKLQEELVARLTREKAEQLRSLSSQLLLFESRLCRKQKEIEANLAQREAIILRQQRVIRQLQNKLRLANESKNNNNNNEGGGSDTGGNGTGTTQVNVTNTRDYSPPCDALDRLDSLGDSDSAVVLEEAFLDDPTPPRFRSNITDITVIRSVSDAVEPMNNKYCSSTRRCNGFLRRPEVLETVYSVEEDGDGDRADNEEEEADEEDNNDESIEATNKAKNQQSSIGDKTRLREFYGSFERLAQQDEQEHMAATTAAGGQNTTNYTSKSGVGHNAQRTRDESQQAQVTYNRVMSNHRSVTKPKDVKYKRINKAKSKSLEELRGRLRNWVEKGNKIAISLDQSYA